MVQEEERENIERSMGIVEATTDATVTQAGDTLETSQRDDGPGELEAEEDHELSPSQQHCTASILSPSAVEAIAPAESNSAPENDDAVVDYAADTFFEDNGGMFDDIHDEDGIHETSTPTHDISDRILPQQELVHAGNQLALGQPAKDANPQSKKSSTASSKRPKFRAPRNRPSKAKK
jgi:hypothetical protein